MGKLLISYTMLNMWKTKSIMDVVSLYTGKFPKGDREVVNEGMQYDRYATDYIKRKKRLPPEFGGNKLIRPITHKKIITNYNKDFDLVTVYDCLDYPNIYEFKSGTSKNAGGYAEGYQPSMFLLQASLAHMPIDKFIICHFNQKTLERDKAVVWNTHYEVEKGQFFINKYAYELKKYLIDIGLHKD